MFSHFFPHGLKKLGLILLVAAATSLSLLTGRTVLYACVCTFVRSSDRSATAKLLWIGSWVYSKHRVSVHDVCTMYAIVSYACFYVVFVVACVHVMGLCVKITFSECFCLSNEMQEDSRIHICGCLPAFH